MKIARYLTAMAALAATFTIATQARADSIDFYLNTVEGSTTTTPTSGGTTAPSPQVEVIVTLTTSNFTTLATGTSDFATVVFEIPGGGSFNAPVGINVNGTFTATSTQGGVTGLGNTSHAGSFNEETGGGTTSMVTYDLTATGTNSWAQAVDVLIANADGWEAADNMGGTPQDLGTYTSTTQTSVTPLPAALPLFATGFGALGLLGWRRKRKVSALAA
jgi:hypothetical protein